MRKDLSPNPAREWKSLGLNLAINDRYLCSFSNLKDQFGGKALKNDNGTNFHPTIHSYRALLEEPRSLRGGWRQATGLQQTIKAHTPSTREGRFPERCL